MRLPNDRILAEKCQGDIDLILGGHDHSSVFEKIGQMSIVKSGTDFEEFSDIKVNLQTREVERTRV
jgi:5'-nucleotidase